MFKIDQKEFIEFRVEFQNALTNYAHEIVGETMQADGEFDGDWDGLRDDCRDQVHHAADRECIYHSDNYKTVQFFQQWFSEEVDEAEQRFDEYGMTFQGLDHYMGALAYFIWESHIEAAVSNRIDELQERAEKEAA